MGTQKGKENEGPAQKRFEIWELFKFFGIAVTKQTWTHTLRATDNAKN